jgi:hypothetical protein
MLTHFNSGNKPHRSFLRSNDSEYGFVEDEFDNFYHSLRLLNQYTVIWPSPAINLVFGQKINLAQNLKDIALKDTLTPYPAFARVDLSDDNMLRHIAERNLVIKRGYSECFLHVNLPSQPRSSPSLTSRVLTIESEKETIRRMSQLNQLYNDMKIEYDDDAAHRPEWLTQPYIPELRKFGELRVLFVNQTPQYVVHTEPSLSSELQMAIGRRFTPLSQLR